MDIGGGIGFEIEGTGHYYSSLKGYLILFVLSKYGFTGKAVKSKEVFLLNEEERGVYLKWEREDPELFAKVLSDIENNGWDLLMRKEGYIIFGGITMDILANFRTYLDSILEKMGFDDVKEREIQVDKICYEFLSDIWGKVLERCREMTEDWTLSVKGMEHNGSCIEKAWGKL